MIGDKVQGRGRSLAEIEIDLLKAEDAFAEADTRFKKAQHDRRAALDLIDKHQVEMDKCFLDLRQRSVPGTKWRQEGGEPEEILELDSEDVTSGDARDASANEYLTSGPIIKAMSKDFERLRVSSHSKSDDPVLKVVSRPR